MRKTALHFGAHYPELILRNREVFDADLDIDDSEADLVIQLILPGADTLRWPFYMSPSDVATFSMGLIDELSDEKFSTDQMNQRPEVHRDRLRTIIRQSHGFLKKGLGGAYLEDFAKALDSIDEGAVLLVNTWGQFSPDFPWGLLHPSAIAKTSAIDASGFLGTRFILAHRHATVARAVRSSEDVHDVFALTGPHSYGFVDDDELASVQQAIERKVLIAHAGTSFDPLHSLDSADETLVDHDDLVTYLLVSRALVHFACHGSAGEEGAATAHYQIRVRQQQMVGTNSLRRLLGARQPDLGELVGPHYKLLFLNICRSLHKTGNNDKSAAHALERLQPQTVIGLQGKVCDLLAANFATHFYEWAFRDNRTVGVAFREAMRQALEATLNPAHLLFVLKGQPDVRIA